jgi:primosomal protein N' (replication factor Y)
LSTNVTYIDAILPLPLNKLFTYVVPPNLLNKVFVGSLIIVPFGRRQIIGLVMNIHQNNMNIECKKIVEVLDSYYTFNTPQLQLMHWLANYYMCSIGQALDTMLISCVYKKYGLAKKKLLGPLSTTFTTQDYDYLLTQDVLQNKLQNKLEADQLKLISDIQKLFLTKDTVLLHSNLSKKEPIYIELMLQESQQFSSQDKFLYLVPDLYTLERVTQTLSEYLPDEWIISYGSNHYSKDIISNIVRDKYKILVGTRSALFLPIKNINLIIIENEHDEAYKQREASPHYHARDLAIILAKYHGAKVLLSSGSPSLESYYNGKKGKYGLLAKIEKKNIQITCITNTKNSAEGISRHLLANIDKTLDKGQVVLLNHRKGYYNYTICNKCDSIKVCPNCSVNLTYYQLKDRLECHSCNYKTKPSPYCDICYSTELRTMKSGTEKIEELLKALYPNKKIARCDKENIKSDKAYKGLIDNFNKGQIDILIGTQMIFKDLSLSNTQIVSVLDVDSFINVSDFRANEKFFQIIAQITNSAPNDNKPRKLIIQTFNRKQPILDSVLLNEYSNFYSSEIYERQLFDYPPVSKLIEITLSYNKQDELVKLRNYLHAHFSNLKKAVLLLPQEITTVKNTYTVKMYVKCLSTSNVVLQENKEIISKVINAFKKPANLKLLINVDP